MSFNKIVAGIVTACVAITVVNYDTIAPVLGGGLTQKLIAVAVLVVAFSKSLSHKETE